MFFVLPTCHQFALPIFLAPVLFPKLPWNFGLFKMPRRTQDAEPVVEPKECVEFDDNEEEVEEEEIEYEEIEEEVEEEVEEDEDISEEVEEVEEEEEDPEEREVLPEIDASHDSDSKSEGVPQHDAAKDGNDKEKHAELLALPPHGSQVYVGGISTDASTEDLKKLCEPVGEVVEVSTAYSLRLSISMFFSLHYILIFFSAGENNARQEG